MYSRTVEGTPAQPQWYIRVAAHISHIDGGGRHYTRLIGNHGVPADPEQPQGRIQDSGKGM